MPKLPQLPTDHKKQPSETEWREAPVQTQGVIIFGHRWSRDGLGPDPNKMQMPEDKESKKSFLGIFNFLGKFYSKFFELSVPLRKISDARGPYQPTPQAVQCFQVIQMILGKDIKSPYFSTKKHTTLQTDASTKGLGAVMIQDGIPVYFASRTLTPAEKTTRS